MKVLYLAGPMTGLPNYNYDAFRDAADAWHGRDWLVTNPAANFGGDQGLPYETYLRKAITQVADADAVAVLPGWEDGQGVCLEVLCATVFKMPVYDARYPFGAYDKDAATLIPPFADHLAGAMERREWLPNQLAIGYVTGDSPESILAEAERLVGGDRQQAYSHPAHDFATTAEFWTTYARRRDLMPGAEFEPQDVAAMMILLKMSRLGHQYKRDSLTDVAGYARCWQLVHDYEEASV